MPNNKTCLFNSPDDLQKLRKFLLGKTICGVGTVEHSDKICEGICLIFSDRDRMNIEPSNGPFIEYTLEHYSDQFGYSPESGEYWARIPR